MFYSMWYNAPKLLPAGGLERGGNKLLLLHLVGLLHYLYQ